jgi:hypothetical protein
MHFTEIQQRTQNVWSDFMGLTRTVFSSRASTDVQNGAIKTLAVSQQEVVAISDITTNQYSITPRVVSFYTCEKKIFNIPEVECKFMYTNRNANLTKFCYQEKQGKKIGIVTHVICTVFLSLLSSHLLPI